jgi:hypothetical protein
MPDRLRPWLALVTATTLLASGCAGLGFGEPTRVAVDLGRPEFQHFDVVRSQTSLERDLRLEDGDTRSRAITTPLFWTGVAVGTLGTIGTLGFAVAGRVSKDKLNDMYADDTGTLVDRNQIRDRGELWNSLAITSGVLMAVGFAVAAVTYGVDWNRCGPLAPKKRQCRNRK